MSRTVRTALSPLPPVNLAPRDVEGLLDELRAYHAYFSPLFARREQRGWGLQYMQGLLSDLPRKSVEPMALALPEGNVRAMQQFIGEGAWPDAAIVAAHQRLVAETLGQPARCSPWGSRRRETRRLGNWRLSRRPHSTAARRPRRPGPAWESRSHPQSGPRPLDRRLYLPQEWFSRAARARRRRCRIPRDVRFQTAPALAWEMIAAVPAAGVLPIGWVAFDEGFGQNPSLVAHLEQAGLRYLAEVPCSTRVWRRPPTVDLPPGSGRGRPRKHRRVAPGAPRPQRVDEVAGHLPAAAGRTYVIKDGAKGAIRAAFAFLRVHPVRARVPGPQSWLVLRRTLGAHPQTKYYLSNAPADARPETLVRVSGQRWPIERAFQECKGELGMDHYETRTWRGWHHHQTLVILAHHFLVRLRLRLKKNRAHDPTSLPADQRRTPTSRLRSRGSHRAGTPPSASELRRLPIAS